MNTLHLLWIIPLVLTGGVIVHKIFGNKFRQKWHNWFWV